MRDAATTAARRTISSEDRIDARELPFVTIDPKGSRDLDQAYTAVERDGGYRVQYAIADVAAFVAPDDAIDREARARGVTLYLPDRRAALHPESLSEGAASLLPGKDRPALLWTIDLDAKGAPTTWRLERALVRSRRAMSYRHVQRLIDTGRAPAPLQLLRTIGELREEQERARGGVSIAVPTQEVRRARGGAVRLGFDVPVASELWNAQISLLAGMCAAQTMIDADVGILRTLPPPSAEATATLRRAARALGIDWTDDQSYASVVRDLHPDDARHAALLVQAVVTLRGAGYTVLDRATTGDPPTHGAIAAHYAHVTAPLRRLVDRFANEILVALSADRTPPGWAVSALPTLPEVMAKSGQRAAAIERAVVDLLECLVLRSRVGDVFPGVVVGVDERGTNVMITEPPVMTRIDGSSPELGAAIDVRLTSADPAERRAVFELSG